MHLVPDHASKGVLAGSWQVLSPPKGHGMTFLPMPDMVVSDVHLALDAEGFRHLLVPTRVNARTRPQEDSPLDDTIRTYRIGHSSGTYLDLRCTRAELYDVFDELILDVLGAAQGATDLGAAVDDALVRWRTMFRAVQQVSLGLTQQHGLFAELSILERLVDINAREALSWWRGPFREPHDFALPRADVEVKAVSPSSREVVFHGLAQLQPSGDRPLAVALLEVVEAQNGRRLDELAASLEVTLGAGALDAHLAASGYPRALRTARFAVTNASFLHVRADFPAITAATLGQERSSSIQRIEYAVKRSALTGFAENHPREWIATACS